MSVRISTTLDLAAGHDNSLDNKIFGGNGVLSELLDTLEHAISSTYEIAGGASQAIDFGDITEARYVYLEGDGEFSVAFTANPATSAIIDGSGGTYPTVFTGGETLELEVDGVAISVAFDAADQTRDQVVARINFVAALTDASFVAVPVAFQNGAELRLKSPTTGLTSEVKVLATSDAAALTALGLTAATANGAAAEPGTTDVEIARPADPTGASAAAGVKAYLLATVQATALQVTNQQASAALNLKAFIAGDLVSTP
jgi:hypothetical protein